MKKNEYTLEHFVNVFHNRHISCRDDAPTRLAKLILYLSGHYSLADEHLDLIQEQKYEEMGKTKPLAKKLDLLLKIFNKCCKLTCTYGFEDKLRLVDYIEAKGEVPENIDEFVKQKLYEYEMEDRKIMKNDKENISLIVKEIKHISKKETEELFKELTK